MESVGAWDLFFSTDRPLTQHQQVMSRTQSLGAIIGEAEIVDCLHESDSIWYQGQHGLLVRNAKLYDEPVPYKGQLGFFEVDESILWQPNRS